MLRSVALSAGAVIVGIGLFGAYSVGRQSTMDEKREIWLQLQSASLMQTTKVAAVMRSGDLSYALELLEHQIDDGVLTIDHYAEQRTPPSFDKRELSAFKLAAVYRAKYQNDHQTHPRPRPQLVQERIRFVLSLGDQEGQLPDNVFADKYLQPNKSLQPIAPKDSAPVER